MLSPTKVVSGLGGQMTNTISEELLKVPSAKPLNIIRETPIQHSEYLSRYSGTNLFVKREDLQDEFGSGVKIRQIATLLDHVQRSGRGPIVIDCVPQSNCGMATCVYSDRFGIPLHVLVKCPETNDRSGNLGRIRASSAKITWVPDRNALDIYRDRVVSDYVAQGLRPTVVPAGANCDITTEGPVGLGVEIARQERRMGVSFSHIVLAVASGGTYAGLQLSFIRHDRRWRIAAVRTDDYDDTYYQKTYADKRRYLRLSPQQEALLPERLELYDGATLGGYGMFGVEHAREAMRIYDECGIFFGPTYTFKALIGTQRMVREGIIPQVTNTLLIHTGGVNERELLPDLIRFNAADL
ncbi:MAG: pyridoxal-phosphate dependent enzyme [Rhodobacteraceae bacterium]|nr:pyridoxal-phosphate dependent enzyme [Paracoccaceae bacterium]